MTRRLFLIAAGLAVVWRRGDDDIERFNEPREGDEVAFVLDCSPIVLVPELEEERDE